MQQELDLQPFRLTVEDLKRHKGHKFRILWVLQGGDLVERDYLTDMGTKNFTARISELRKEGYDIRCYRDGADGGTYYRLHGKVDGSLTKQMHECPSCGTRF